MNEVKTEIMNIVGIKVGESFCITRYTPEVAHTPYNSLEKLLVNGEFPTSTFRRGWCEVQSIPVQIQKEVKPPNINYRFELIDESMASDKLPLVWQREDVAKYIDYEWVWQVDYSTYRSLYRTAFDEQPMILEEVAFEYSTIIEVEKLPGKFSLGYNILKDPQWNHQGTTTLRKEQVHHQLLDLIVYPDLVMPLRPSSLSRDASFEVIRQHVKENINPKVAEVTSDYRFCFTVKKKIPLSETQTYQVDVNWMRKRRKPKYQTRYRTDRAVECFEMAPKAYQNYSVLEGFRGESEEDLKQNIDEYLARLMNHINEPIEDCKKCKGRGVIINETLKNKGPE